MQSHQIMAGNSCFNPEIGLTNLVSSLIRRCVSIVFAGLMLVAIVLLQPSRAWSQVHETFDSSEVSWVAVKELCHCKVEPGSVKHLRTTESETGASCEQFLFNAASGSDLMVAHDVTPAMVIPELTGTVRIKSARRGVQLCARALLPHCSAPGSMEPLTVILKGPIGRQRDRWETLKFDGKHSFKKLLESEKWILRGRYGDSITIRDAYIDRLMLNIYTGPGESNILIDDLKFTGIVEATNAAKQDLTSDSDEGVALIASHLNADYTDETVRMVAAQQDVKRKKTHVVRDGTVILVDERPFFPIIIEHNGESFEYLKAIGFNTVELRGSPTAKQLAEARESNMWLIAPPPPSVGISQLGREYDSVLAWSVGKNLTDRDVSSVRQRVREIRESDTREGRPIFGHAKSHWKRIAQMVDIQALGQQPIGTSYIASRYSDWIEQRAREVGSSKPVCADIQTEMNPAVIEQAKAIFGAGTKTPTPIEFQQLKTLVVEAITAGSRCLRYRSDSRLDAGDPVTRLRASTVQYVNRWLEQVEPWVSGGAVMGVLPVDDRGHGIHGDSIRVTALNTNRGRLLLVQRPTHHEQFWAGDVPQKSITIIDSDTIHTNRVYHLTDAELKPVSTQRTPQGTVITIEDAPYMSTIVMTQDAAVVNQLTGVLSKPGRQSMFDLHLSITQQWRVIQQLLDGQIGRLGKGTPASSGAMNEAISAIQNVQRLSQQKSYAQAMPFLDRADERLAFFRRELQAAAMGNFQSKTSSPLVAHAGLIPLHWLLAGQIPRSEAAINHLPGGDFEDKSLTIRSGWGNTRVEDSRLMTDVAFETRAARDGKYGLKLKVEGRGISIVDAPPLRVTSPPVRVKPRQLVRIHGWVNIPKVITGSDDGFRIVESLGGESLAETIPVTQGWQEFTLYRSAVEDTQLRIELQLTGLGEAMVDEVTVQVIDLPAPARSAKR